jgi:predicted DNA-binding ribbon-helix-helix protein
MYITHSVSAGDSETDVSMEEEFWDCLRDIAADRNTTFSVLINEVVAKVDGAVETLADCASINTDSSVQY